MKVEYFWYFTAAAAVGCGHLASVLLSRVIPPTGCGPASQSDPSHPIAVAAALPITE